VPDGVWLERATARQADGLLNYSDTSGRKVSEHFRFTDSFDPQGSTLAQASLHEGKLRLCLKSDWMEWLPDGDGFMLRRAFKECVEMTPR